MILIADSGSSITEWCLLDGESISQYQCIGLNPFIVDEHIIRDTLSQLEISFDKITELHFYGAGCGSYEKSNIMQTVLQSVFSCADIMVYSDLLAAARSLFQKNEGVVGILGTGSNSCFFDGDKLVDLIPALGYVLGDEGSGSYFGKKLLSSFLYKKLPKEIEQNFLEKFDLNSEKIIERVYQEGNANVYLVSFMPFIASHKENKFIQEMIKEGFKNFINTHVLCYENIENAEVNFVGSISSVFENELKEVAKELKINVGQIIRKPAESLVNYHKKYLL